MTTSDRLQHQRFELKFPIDEDLAIEVRKFVRAYLDPDEFAYSSPTLSYPVHSLYLDSESLGLYRATINGDCDRFKLRARYYDDAPAAPVFLEIKRRTNDCIRKTRAGVKRSRVAALLSGARPQLADLLRPDIGQLAALRRFCDLAGEIDACPRSHIAYDREAWVSPADNSLRVTFDRAVRSEPQLEYEFGTRFARPASVFAEQVILEIKFTDRYPRWIGELIQAFELTRSGAAKYVGAIDSATAPVSHRSVRPACLNTRR